MSAAQPPAQRLGGVADLALAAEEHEHVARRPRASSSSTASPIASGLVRSSRRRERPVADLDRVRAARRPRRPARRRSARRSARGSIVAEVMMTFRSGRRGRSCVR